MDIDKLMLQVPELPRDFEQWVRNVPLSDSKYMFTFRDGQGSRKGYCTHCEKIVDLDYRNRRIFEMVKCSLLPKSRKGVCHSKEHKLLPQI